MLGHRVVAAMRDCELAQLVVECDRALPHLLDKHPGSAFGQRDTVGDRHRAHGARQLVALDGRTVDDSALAVFCDRFVQTGVLCKLDGRQRKHGRFARVVQVRNERFGIRFFEFVRVVDLHQPHIACEGHGIARCNDVVPRCGISCKAVSVERDVARCLQTTMEPLHYRAAFELVFAYDQVDGKQRVCLFCGSHSAHFTLSPHLLRQRQEIRAKRVEATWTTCKIHGEKRIGLPAKVGAAPELQAEGFTMGFLDEVDSIRTKAHMTSVPKPVLVGVVALAVVIALLAYGSVATAVRTAGDAAFEITKASEHAADSKADGASTAQDATEGGDDPATPAASKTARAVVHVSGAVISPGVYELDATARVQAAIDAAGGFAEHAARDAVNCARVIQDGEQILVPTLEQAQGAPSGGAAGASGAVASGTASPKVNINQASAEELDTLPGVGPSTAQKIIADREANGPFATIEDLKRVSGIGDKKYEQMAALICV